MISAVLFSCRVSSFAGWVLLIAAHSAAQTTQELPHALSKGPHLLLDEHFVERSAGVERKVIAPQRFLDRPIVTSAPEHQNWQPFLTVLHEPGAPRGKSFRMWYNADVLDDPADGAFSGKLAYLESADGIHWPGPYQRLESMEQDGRYRIGASVIDAGPQHSVAAERYRMLFYDSGKHTGPRLAFSPDGLQWSAGGPILNYGSDIWTLGFDPLRGRHFIFGKVTGPFTWTNAGGRKVTADIRRYALTTSRDLKTWSDPKVVFSPDEKDAGITQWYGPAGFLVRGDLLITFLRVLRDDLSPAGAPREAIAANTQGNAGLGASGLGADGGSGTGYTVLAWTRDGETWHRDREEDKFLDADPAPGAWDHAMAWVGSAVPVGDDVHLYYCGYRWGHKYRHSVDRQIGLVKVRRDRFVARQAGEKGGTLTTHPVMFDADALTLNVDALKGEVRVQITGADGRPVPGFAFADCEPIVGDSLEAPVRWKKQPAVPRGRSVRLEFSLRNARLFAFELK